ncbi:DUF262 domain-containing protein [Aquibium sp. ELW1220]|uniref:DUF262 domain-containing protein n=1 Tax=Aquibium sp. ELW1220 TaxID=2976766 RepID=UPI0025B0D9FB|nr:DUF262 domain-containing protein [Aquibium sp. ELW1220]MDN2584340.1 DUF262 domain-containing protein [Aquibium sp. ELW1220]
MEAFNRELGNWYQKIESGQLRLPRFQRPESWERSNVVSVIDSIVRGLPIGALLVLEVENEEPFISRNIDIKNTRNQKCTELLLDGQQRITAIWKSLNDYYEDSVYFLRLDDQSERSENEYSSRVVSVTRWKSENGRWHPRWIEDPASIYSRNLVPLYLFRPSSDADQRQQWCDKAVSNDHLASRKLENSIRDVKERINHFNIPMLVLKSDTTREVALDIFIRVNTKGVALSAMDLVVAQLEARTKLSLSEMNETLYERCPALRLYDDGGQYALQAALLRDNKLPSQAFMLDLDLKRVADNWQELTDGLVWAIEFLASEGVITGAFLPTAVVVPVIAALHKYLPTDPNQCEKAKDIVREYMWRSFITGRYENSSMSKSLSDYRVVRDCIVGVMTRPDKEIFDQSIYKVPSIGSIIRAGWPRRRDMLGRAVFLLSIRNGAVGLIDGRPVDSNSIPDRSLVQIFADYTLRIPSTSGINIFNTALNCILVEDNIVPKTQLKNVPIVEILSKTDIDRSKIDERIASHSIPIEEFRDLVDLSERVEDVNKEIWNDKYSSFIYKRASLAQEEMRKLINDPI